VRFKNVALMTATYQLSRRRPELVKKLIRNGVQNHLPVGFDVDTQFNPNYNPWDQRLCVCPDGDLFDVLSDGRAAVVTGQIENITERAVTLSDGSEIEADLIVTATGLNLLVLGGMELAVDGQTLDLRDHMVYKGAMLSGVPNLAMCVGYTNASWTLKCDLTCEWVCRMLNRMDRAGESRVVAELDDDSVTPVPLIDLNSGYVLRSIQNLPTQGSKRPWRLYQNYALDVMTLRLGELEDGVLRFSNGQPAIARDGRLPDGRPAPQTQPA
jgi:cation diffusion facilitator CzcD-associated flavoprotein CzcO